MSSSSSPDLPLSTWIVFENGVAEGELGPRIQKALPFLNLEIWNRVFDTTVASDRAFRAQLCDRIRRTLYSVAGFRARLRLPHEVTEPGYASDIRKIVRESVSDAMRATNPRRKEVDDWAWFYATRFILHDDPASVFLRDGDVMDVLASVPRWRHAFVRDVLLEIAPFRPEVLARLEALDTDAFGPSWLRRRSGVFHQLVVKAPGVLDWVRRKGWLFHPAVAPWDAVDAKAGMAIVTVAPLLDRRWLVDARATNLSKTAMAMGAGNPADRNAVYHLARTVEHVLMLRQPTPPSVPRTPATVMMLADLDNPENRTSVVLPSVASLARYWETPRTADEVPARIRALYALIPVLRHSNYRLVSRFEMEGDMRLVGMEERDRTGMSWTDKDGATIVVEGLFGGTRAQQKSLTKMFQEFLLFLSRDLLGTALFAPARMATAWMPNIRPLLMATLVWLARRDEKSPDAVQAQVVKTTLLQMAQFQPVVKSFLRALIGRALIANMQDDPSSKEPLTRLHSLVGMLFDPRLPIDEAPEPTTKQLRSFLVALRAPGADPHFYRQARYVPGHPTSPERIRAPAPDETTFMVSPSSVTVDPMNPDDVEAFLKSLGMVSTAQGESTGPSREELMAHELEAVLTTRNFV